MADGTVYNGERVVGYLTSALRAGVDATRSLLNSERYKAVHGYDEIPVNMEYPQEGQRYPYVQVMYQNSRFYPSTFEECRMVPTRDGVAAEIHPYLFEGQYIVSIYANTILERETIADCMIGMMGIDNAYRDAFYGSRYINVSPNMHTLSSNVSNESVGTPWDADAMTCYRQFKFDVKGEFVYKVDDAARYVSAFDVEAETGYAFAGAAEDIE